VLIKRNLKKEILNSEGLSNYTLGNATINILKNSTRIGAEKILVPKSGSVLKVTHGCKGHASNTGETLFTNPQLGIIPTTNSVMVSVLVKGHGKSRSYSVNVSS
jgi:hypothetical protein